MSVVAVVGLGYVGLRLAVELGNKRKSIGFDLSHAKVESHRRFIDPTGELSREDVRAAVHLTMSTEPAALAQCTNRRSIPAPPRKCAVRSSRKSPECGSGGTFTSAALPSA